jgi:REP element-mobilizing transposase RayT
MHIFHKRQGQVSAGRCYFFTASIRSHHHLLESETCKQTLIERLQYLKGKGLIRVYGYVIMPNHIHLIWEILSIANRETPAASFLKYTARSFGKFVKNSHFESAFQSTKKDRSLQFWNRDPLAVVLSSERALQQKLDYIHHNPLQPHWKLCEHATEYRWSSARFYCGQGDEFRVVTHYRD